MEDALPYGTDPDDREIRTPEDADRPVFGFQYQYPLGIMGAVLGSSMAEAVKKLNGAGIEPFSLTRIGVVIEL